MWSTYPFGGAEAGAVHSAPLLFLTSCFCSQFFKSGSWTFWSFCILLSRICPKCTCSYFCLLQSLAVQNLPQMHMQSVTVSLYFVAPEDVGPGASIAAKGPRFQSVSEPNFVIRSNWHSGLRLHHFISLKSELICKREDGSTTQSISVSKMKFYILLLISENILLPWSLLRKHLVQYEI